MTEPSGLTPDVRSPAVPTVALAWRPAVRLVGAEWPPVVAIEDARSPEEIDGAMALMGATDPSRAIAAGAWAALLDPDRRYGRGASDAMTPYLFAGTGRFSEPAAGAFYAADTLDTALAEALHHRQRLFADTGAGTCSARFRHLLSDLAFPVADARAQRTVRPFLYDTAAAGTEATRAFAAELRARGARGLAYDSVRREGGHCVAVFRARDVGVPVEEVGIIERHWHPSAGWLI